MRVDLAAARVPLPTAPIWRYGRNHEGVEQAVWDGHFSRPLSPHFHPEIQITIVRAGRRDFLTTGGLVTVGAGETLIVPSGQPHQALGLASERTLSFNLYLSPPSNAQSQGALVVRTPCWLRGATDDGRSAMVLDWASHILNRSRKRSAEPIADAIATVVADDHLSIADIASKHGVSREGFIRWFRRHAGMTPHAYRVVHRLNRARGLLAAGTMPAQAAAEAGFADQSHMGRHFRRAFGVAPGTYRCAVRS
jgi:AraC-like DNA-binding protein/mannose-6-phosphate isomerase-like protein (cupin superfamily)